MKRLEIKRFTSKMLGANTYIIYNNNKGLIVDPCTKVHIVKEFCDMNDIEINKILLTHCHIDHILYVDEYTRTFSCQVAIQTDGNKYMMDSNLNGSRLFGMNKEFKSADILLKDSDLLSIGDFSAKIISTPGHSPGSMAIYADKILVSGDTLFNMSIGRSDLPGGNQTDLEKSLSKLMDLPDDTIIYPGHGTFSTIKFERENNPYLINLI